MDNKESGSITITVILVLLIIGLCSYVACDKLISKQSNRSSSTSSSQNNKSATDTKAYKAYSIGDKITFANEEWHVISNSGVSTNYTTALKDETIPELDGKPFYECPKADDNGINCSMKMSNDYQKSAPKSYFDNTYVNTLGKTNLKDVDGYFIRLPKLEELIQLGCKTTENLTGTCSNVPEWLVSKSISWTMSTTNGSTTEKADEANVWTFGPSIAGDAKVLETSGVGSTLNVRPVINLLKSSIK